MQVQTTNVNFTGKIQYEEKILTKNPLFKYAKNRLKHHCGSHNVEHNLTFDKNGDKLSSVIKFFKKDDREKWYSLNILKTIDLSSKEKIDESINEINLWLRRNKRA